MELTSEDAGLLLIASEKVHLKLKRDRSRVHEINQSRGQHGEYHHVFPQLKADGERFFFFFNILECILKSSPTFCGRLNTAGSRICVTFINYRVTPSLRDLGIDSRNDPLAD